jgi:hypothetical protein
MWLYVSKVTDGGGDPGFYQLAGPNALHTQGRVKLDTSVYTVGILLRPGYPTSGWNQDRESVSYCCPTIFLLSPL